MKIFTKVSLATWLLSTAILFTPIVYADTPNTGKSAKGAPLIITDKNVVAIVNDQKVTRQELYNLLIDTYGEDALDVLIRRTLICQTAKKEGVVVTKSEVDEKLKSLVNNEIDALLRNYRLKDKADLEKELNKVGSSLAQLEDRVSRRMGKQAEIELLAEKTMEKTVVPTEDELQKAYEEEYGEKIDACQIVLKTRREAEETLKKLQSGADFATLSKNDSIDRASAIKGGKMQPFSPKSGIGPEVSHLKAGELSDIIKTDYGYHVVKILNKIPASNKSFKSVKEDLEKMVRNRLYRDRLGPWLINLIENASITKNLSYE